MSTTNPPPISANSALSSRSAPSALDALDALDTLSSRLTFEVGTAQELSAVLNAPPLPAFAPTVLAFTHELSAQLRHEARCRVYPDLLALGFWLREGNLQRLMQAYTSGPNQEQNHGPNQGPNQVRLGRGLAFHFAPNNVATLFAYSLILSLLAGNSNVVRLGQRSTPEQQVLLQTIQDLLAQAPFAALKERLLIVRYGHDDDINRYFCAHCAVRVIWGGDSTVQQLRALPMPAGSVELTFANKFSWAMIDAQGYLDLSTSQGPQASAMNFVTDAFSFGQQGCSSPRLILWRGSDEQIAQAQARFWSSVDAALTQRPFTLSPAQVSERFLAANSAVLAARRHQAAHQPKPLLPEPHHEHAAPALTPAADGSSYLRLSLNCWEELERESHQGNGLFYELKVTSLEEVLRHCSDQEQTICSLGISAEAWHQALTTTPPRGLCRIVALGRALEFNRIWDGHDLIATMSRALTLAL
ncbi:MAG TPA: hypothetical protein H9898_03205 [Candidatus Anaerobiospirillum stercoravium]|nr:hypothetical protein [Candidatus Anaerobiospirillum stercoravium]